MRRVTSVALSLAGALVAVLVGSCNDNPVEPTRATTPAHIPVSLATASTASGATLTTDKDDYTPGDTLRLAGWGWQPGDTLDLHLDEDPQNHPPVDWIVAPDADGRFWDSTYVVQESDLGVTFALTATSRATSETATAVFFDFGLGKAFINSVSSTTVPVNSSLTITAGAARTTSGSSTYPTWAGTSFQFTTTSTIPNSGYGCLSPAKPDPAVTVTATASPGTDGGSMTISTTGLTRGTRYLFIRAEASTTCNGAAGSGSDGQALTITGPDLSILKTHTGNFTRGGTGTYTIAVSNVGEVATSGLVTVSDPLPAQQFTFSSVTATGWSCATPAVGASGTVSCTRSDALASGSTYPDITLVVGVNASGGNDSPTNTVTVTNASDAGPGNNSDDDPTTLEDAPATQLVFTTAAFNIAAGACSPAISVQSRNASNQPTNPSVAVTVNLTSTSGGGTFYSNAGCTTPITSTSIPTNSNHTADFYYKDTQAGTPTLTAADAAANLTSATQQETITQAATTTTVTANKTSPQEFGTSVTFTAAVKRTSDNSAVTAGSVTFYDGGTCASPGTELQAATAVNGSGQVPFTTTTLSVAAHTVLACYGGTVAFTASSGTLAFTITTAATGTTVTANQTSPQEFGTSVTFTAAVKRSSDASVVTVGSVTFYDGGSCASPGTQLQAATAVNGSGQVPFTTTALGVGAHTILACYDGGSTGFGDSSGTLAFTITAIATTTTVTASLSSPQEWGISITFTATVKRSSDNSAVTVGSVIFYDGGTCASPGTELQAAAAVNGSGQAPFTTSALDVGAHTILACYGGSGGLGASSGTIPFTITTVATTTTVTSNKTSPQQYGTSITFTATVKRSSNSSVVTVGSVTYYDGGTCASPGTELKSATAVNGSGQVALTTSALELGDHTILACYGGTAIFDPSYGTFAMHIDPVTTSATVTVTPSSQQYSDKVELKAEITPYDVLSEHLTGTVYFYVGASAVTCGTSAPLGSVGSDGIADVDDGVGTYPYTVIDGAGSYTVTACFYSTNTHFTDSDDTGSLTVTRENATLGYDSNNPTSIQVGSPGGTANVSLKVTVVETNTAGVEPNGGSGNTLPGDITKATVNVVLSSIANGGTVTLSCADPLSAGTYPTRTLTCTASNVAPNTFEVQVSVSGNYYTATALSEVLTVFDPSLGFTTGGGWLYWPGSTDRTNFGFTIKYNKSGTNPQGSLLVIRHKPDGTTQRFKSNALSGLALSPVNSYPGTATFSGKGNYIETNWASAVQSTFSAYVEDGNNPGTGPDKFWLAVAGYAPLLLPTPGATNAIQLNGGNIQVPHTRSTK